MPFGTAAEEEIRVSAQAGIWNFDGRPVSPRLIADFHRSLVPLGPDGETCWQSSSIAMLYRPFHTTAESRREKQPYVSQRGFVITWDGRLDNREELASEFRSYVGSESTDVALVATAFDHWETGSFRRLVGDWAVSVWRPEERELVFACDYMAVRHIFYHARKDCIWWSTDLAPLVLLSGDTLHIDDEYIAGYFAHDPDSHLTPYREIRQVPAGRFVSVRAGSTRCERYWRFSPKSRIRYKSDSEYEEHFRHVFRQSVRRRLRCDSPVLAELSGGLDSSSIVCMADDILAKEGAQTSRLDTLSYHDKADPRGDDWIYFQKVEAHRGRAGHRVDASRLGASPGALESEEFRALPGFLNFGKDLEAQRSTVVREGGYRVVFSGVGGDDFFGGVPDPRVHLADLLVQCRFVRLAKQLAAWSLVKRRPWIQLLWHASVEMLPPNLGRYVMPEADVEPWIDESFARTNRLSAKRLEPGEQFGMWLPSRRAYIAGVLAMGNRLSKIEPRNEEARFPFLDQHLIEFILSIPASQLLRPGDRRSLMRRSLKGIVPGDILSRPTKQLGTHGFLLVLDKQWSALQTLYRSSISSRLGYISERELLRVLDDARTGRIASLTRVLSAISLEIWLRDLAERGLLDFPKAFFTSHPAEAALGVTNQQQSSVA